MNTLEVAFKLVPEQDGSIRIDDQFCAGRLAAYKVMFPELDCVGWYSADLINRDAPHATDALVHKRFQKFSENPLFLKLNPESKEANERKQLPYFLYELD